jgi:hypothetical protein
MKLISIITLFILTACGFSPIYQMHGTQVIEDLSNIDIAIIPNEEGVIVRNYLIDQLYKNGYPKNAEYRLITNPVQEQIIEIAIDQDDNASRAQLRQNTSFKLVQISNNQPVLERTVRATTGYNILDSQFTTFVTRSDAREQALRVLADKIIIQLELHFSRENRL